TGLKEKANEVHVDEGPHGGSPPRSARTPEQSAAPESCIHWMNDSSLNWPDGIRAVYEGVQAQPAVRAHPIALTDAALQTGDGAGGGLPGVTVGAAEPIALAAVPPAVWQAELDRQDRVLRGAAEAMHLLLTTPRFVPAL